MTSIHARIPATMRQAVDSARRQGEEDPSSVSAAKDMRAPASRINARLESTLLRKKLSCSHPRPPPLPLTRVSAAGRVPELSEDEEDHDPSKENDPSQSLSPVTQSPRSPRKNVLGKRPLSELPVPIDPEDEMTESEKNIAVNQVSQNAVARHSSPQKKSPRLAVTLTGADVSGKWREEALDGPSIPGSCMKTIIPSADEEKENYERTGDEDQSATTKIPIRISPSSDTASLRSTLRKVSNVGPAKGKLQSRVGIRRL